MYRLMNADMFTFLVGPDKTAIRVHKNIFQDLSAPLHALINGEMKEAMTESCELTALEPEIFMALVEYAYRGYLFDSATAFLNKYTFQHDTEADLERFANCKPDFKSARAQGITWGHFFSLGKRIPSTMRLFKNLPHKKQDAYTKSLEHPAAYFFYTKLAAISQMYLLSELELEASRMLHFLLRTVISTSSPPGTLLELLMYVNSDVDVLPSIREMVFLWFASTGPSWHNCKGYNELLENDPQLTLEIYFLSIDPKYYGV